MNNLRPSQVAQLLGVKTVTVRAWLNQGKFPTAFQEESEFFHHRVWRIPEEAVREFRLPKRGRPQKKTLLK